jgi:hypothetical protein
VEEEPEPVSRKVQAGSGLSTRGMVYSTAFGGLFAMVFALADRRATGLSPRAVSALLRRRESSRFVWCQT